MTFESNYGETEIGGLDEKIHSKAMNAVDIKRLQSLYEEHKDTSIAVQTVYKKYLESKKIPQQMLKNLFQKLLKLILLKKRIIPI